MKSDRYKEIWINGADGQFMCALINDDIGLMVYF